jgi:hypothetical protein
MGINKVEKSNSFNFGPAEKLGKSNDGRETANVGSQDDLGGCGRCFFGNKNIPGPGSIPLVLPCIIKWNS